MRFLTLYLALVWTVLLTPTYGQIATVAWTRDLSTIVTAPSYGGKGRQTIVPAFDERIFVFGDKVGGGQVVLWIDKDSTILHREDLSGVTSVWSNPVDKVTCIIDIARTANYSQELWRLKEPSGIEKQILKKTTTNLRTAAETLSGSLDGLRPPHPQTRFYLLTDNGLLTAYDVIKNSARIKLAATTSAGTDGPIRTRTTPSFRTEPVTRRQGAVRSAVRPSRPARPALISNWNLR